MKKTVATLFFCAASLFGQHAPKTTIANVPAPYPRHPRIWLASLATMWAGEGLDAYSSWGKYELNPVLKNQQAMFSTKGAILKGALVGVSTFAQFKLHTRPRAEKFLSIENFAIAGLGIGLAAHNFGVPQAK